MESKIKLKFNPLIPVQDDGLIIPEFGPWAIEKYKLVGSYCDIFTTGMQKNWDKLIYLDLFAGAGFAKNEETKIIYRNAALLALSTPVPFSKYIFCEYDTEKLSALKTRVYREFPLRFDSCVFIEGDSNINVNEIKEHIPKYSRESTMLSFCFVDPYSLNLNFETIKTLGKIQMDFLILQALPMDGRRNFENYYMNDENEKIARYLGMKDWRKIFDENGLYKQNFMRFLAEQFQSQMVKLKYLPELLTHPIKLKSGGKNVLLYYLSFYTKHPRGKEFFNKVKRGISSQTSLEF